MHEAIKRVINSRIDFRFAEAVKKAEAAEVVSFDIFDTLLKRSVERPSDVFHLVEERFNKNYARKIDSYAQIRIRAERAARESGGREEAVFEDIFNFMPEFTQDEKASLMQYERQIEYDAAMPNRPVKAVYDWCKAHHKKIVCVSDMYFPASFLQKLLAKCGYSAEEQIFISADLGLGKGTGHLFEHVLKALDVPAEKMLHIGDALRGDFISPGKMGIRTYRVPMRFGKHQAVDPALIPGGDRLHFSAVQAFIRNSVDPSWDRYYRFGYECFGMLLWGFCKWLRAEMSARGIERVYFFSRDGHIMKRAFDRLHRDDPKVRSAYLEVSRRSLRIPVLWMDPELRTVLNMISYSMHIPLATLFDGVGLDMRDYADAIRSSGLDADFAFSHKDALKDERLTALYERIKPDVAAHSKAEYPALQDYMRQMGLGGKMAIVDIGWTGSMQRYLTQALRETGVPCDISGYYMGVLPGAGNNLAACPMDLNGYLFDFSSGAAGRDIHSAFIGLFESLFLEQEGSVENYTREAGGAHANRLPYEYRVDGVIQEEARHVADIQEGALQFIEDVEKAEHLRGMKLSPETLFARIRMAVTYPGREEMDMFQNFRFFDEGTTLYFARPRSMAHYLFHLRDLKADFFRSRWRIGFLKRLIKLPLPYEQLYARLLALKEKIA